MTGRSLLHRGPRGTGLCWVRMFKEPGQTRVIAVDELLAAEPVQRHFPHRFEELPLAIFLEHYVEERTPERRLGRKATWGRLPYHSWVPQRVWLS